MARLANNKTILNKLEKLRTTQTKFREQQEIDLESFIIWRDKVLGITKKLHGNCNINTRRQGLWVLGMQIIYGLRISEVFAIKNLDKSVYDKKTNKLIVHAYNDVKKNPYRLIYIGEKTIIGTTVKTGSRLARPMESPKHPNLYYEWDLHNPKLPDNQPEENSRPTTFGCFYPNLIAGWLKDWKAPFTQTHADRRLGNLLGMQAGIPQEVRAKSLGHNVLTNDKHYTSGSIQTQIDILTQSNKQAIDFTSGLLEAKRVIEKYPSSQVPIVELLAKIYQKSEMDIEELLD